MKVVASAGASRPGNGRRLLVPRALGKNGPEYRPRGTPHDRPILSLGIGARQVNFHSVVGPDAPRRRGTAIAKRERHALASMRVGPFARPYP